jgi:hypothetical protein
MANTSDRRLVLGLVAIVENGVEIVSYNDAVIFIADPAADSGDDQTEITITTTNFSALGIAKDIVDRFNAATGVDQQQPVSA